MSFTFCAPSSRRSAVGVTLASVGARACLARRGPRSEESPCRTRAQWERHAGWWQREFTAGADPEYEDQILPLVARHLAGARRVLDIGCGEGQVARRAAGLGAEVVGLDPPRSQVACARDAVRRSASTPGRAPRRCRVRTASFDTVLVCLALEHVDAYETAIAEVARVLEPGGRFVLVLCHPLLQAPGSGWIDDRILGEHYWRVGAYLRDDRQFDEVAPGVDLLFIHRPLQPLRARHGLGRAR